MNRFPISCYLLLSALLLVLGTYPAPAQESGPIQPEAVGGGGGGGVDEFTGSFSYSLPLLTVPGPNGSGYTVVLSYRSGAPFSEASWVGYGWSLGPGAIIRDKRGFADDVADTMTFWRKTKPQYTIAASYILTGEALSKVFHFSDMGVDSAVADSLKKRLDSNLASVGNVGIRAIGRYNSLMGYSMGSGLSAAMKGIGGMDFSVDDDGASFRPYVSPNALLDLAGYKLNDKLDAYLATMLRTGVHDMLSGNHYPSRIMTGFTGGSTNFDLGFNVTIPAYQMGIKVGSKGSMTWRRNIPVTKNRVVGYMYSGQADTDSNAIMDYRVERDIPYHKESHFLSLPFANKDNFILAGVGLFNVYQRSSGLFRPNFISSSFDLIQAGTEVTGGGRWGIGQSFGYGHYFYGVTPWLKGEQVESHGFSATRDQPFFFRMNSDAGGNVLLASDYGADVPQLESIALFPPSWAASVDGAVSTSVNMGGRVGRTTYIGSHTNAAMLDTNGSGELTASYNRDPVSRAMVTRSDASIRDGIGEFAVTDAQGNRYVYGLPVYSRNEKKLMFGMENVNRDDPSSIKSNYLIYRKSVADSAEVVIGEESAVPYATDFLLTEITTPDYIDRTNDGPTGDDFGGYTVFHYRRAAGSSLKTGRDSTGSWFRWRMPYNGLYFEKNNLFDLSDDYGSVNTGEREVYYLESIETKTHIAYFVTNKTSVNLNGRTIAGSGVERGDGYPQMAFASDSIEALVAGDSTATLALSDSLGHPAANIQEKLERIELYVKTHAGYPDSLLQTVYFDHDYSLRRGMPNSLADSAGRGGLLTLKRVWSKDQAVITPKISPYVFGYTYADSASFDRLTADVSAKYAPIVKFGDSLSTASQNPSYSPYDADRWGAYRRDGSARSKRLNPWVSQRRDSAFDPAAWQLKSVRTPTGGELHVQYEQHDYSYVQDRPAMAMVSLLDTLAGTSMRSYDLVSDNHYYLNLGDIAIDSTSYQEVAQVASMIRRELSAKKKLAYFRFLYSINGDEANIDSAEYRSEYIRGYSNIDSIVIDTVKRGQPDQWYALRLTLRGTYKYPIPVVGAPESEWSVPKKVCWDYVFKRKRGIRGPEDEIPFGAPLGMVVSLLGRMMRAEMDTGACCRDIDYANSYIRIPLVKGKLGGGIRVKRLLGYDPGISGDGTLTGTEYLYQEYDRSRGAFVSSGVALNEPLAGREENSLVGIATQQLERELGEKVVAGDEMSDAEGPIGESALPGASIGYARVVARSIHTGKTNPGFAINEFFTARDYPFDKDYGSFGKGMDISAIADHSYHPPYLSPTEWYSVNIDHLWGAQGVRFIQNGMHGALRRSSSYGGEYSDQNSWALAGSRELTYFEPGEKIPVVRSLGDSIRLENLGVETEVATEGASLNEAITDGHVEADANFGYTLDPQFSGNASADLSFSSLRTMVTTKVMRYPVIVKSVMGYADGVYSSTENVAFNPETGQPVITRSSDGYDKLKLEQASSGQKGIYHSYQIPASWIYPQMGQIAAGEGAVIKSAGGLTVTKDSAGATTTLSFSPSNDPSLGALTKGARIMLRNADSSDSAGVYTITAVGSGWVQLSAEKLPSHDSAGSVDIVVLEGGGSNQLGAMAGGLTTYGETAAEVASGANMVAADSVTMTNSHVISAGAVEFGNGAITYPSGEGTHDKIWRPISNYLYRTGISGGSKQSTSERAYNGGILDDFTLFKWASPSSNDSTKWLRLGTITAFNQDGVPIETKDGMGFYSGVKVGYNNMLPIASAVNARPDQIMFHGFDEDASSVSAAHSGNGSYPFTSSGLVNLGNVTVYGAQKDTSVLIRFWMKFSDYAMKATPGTYLGVHVGSTVATPTVADEVAQSGEWTLYELRKKISVGAAVKDSFTVKFYTSSLETNGDSVWLDDFSIQPLDAVMTCNVYDGATYRPLTTFDAQHFGVYSQYTAEGRPVRTIVETTEGKKTVMEVQPHIPLTADRNPAVPGSRPGEGSRGRKDRLRGGMMGPEVLEGARGNNNIDLLNIELGSGKKKVEVLGSGNPTLPKPSSMPDIGMPKIPAVERLAHLKELHALADEEARLVSERANATTAEAVARIHDRREMIRKRREELLGTLGMTEEQARGIYETLDGGRESGAAR